jgi:RimJ/RimL family protein N-acetyltransferase
MAILTTQRLIVREMTDADLDDMAALLGDAEVMRYYPRPKTREEAQGWINWNRALYSEHGFGLWLMTLAETGEFVGECGLTVQHVDEVTEIEVGYHVRTDLQGLGYAVAAGRSQDRPPAREAQHRLRPGTRHLRRSPPPVTNVAPLRNVLPL